MRGASLNFMWLVTSASTWWISSFSNESFRRRLRIRCAIFHSRLRHGHQSGFICHAKRRRLSATSCSKNSECERGGRILQTVEHDQGVGPEYLPPGETRAGSLPGLSCGLPRAAKPVAARVRRAIRNPRPPLPLRSGCGLTRPGHARPRCAGSRGLMARTAAAVSGSIVNPSRAAKRTERKQAQVILTERCFGSPIARIIPACKSARPPTKSKISFVLESRNRALIVKSRRRASCSGFVSKWTSSGSPAIPIRVTAPSRADLDRHPP